MVYEGRPSQGCGTCRKRRIKCDQQRPTCGQCIKSRRECLGYRNQSELMFVSENQNLHAKATGKKGKRIAISRRHSSSSSDSGTGSSLQSIPKPLLETTERQALTYFFSEYVALPNHQDAMRGFIECLLPIYADAQRDSALFDATTAAALATFSHKRQSSRLKLHSHIYYGKAVATLQDAIGDPAVARSNDTLMAILILGLYETMTATEKTVFEWGHHVEGANALVQYRGIDEMLSDPTSSRMYWAVRVQAVWSCVIRCEPLAPFLDWESLWNEPVTHAHGTHSNQIVSICERLPALRCAGAKWTKAPMSATVALRCVEIIGHCRVVDQLLAAWAFEAPTSWRPRMVGTVEGTISDPDETFLYPGQLDSYCDLWVAGTWNLLRTMRIVCLTIIVNCLERLYPESELPLVPEYQCAVATIQHLADGICASIPYHFGHTMPAFNSPLSADAMPQTTSRDDMARPLHREEPHDAERSVRSLGPIYLLLPLFVTYSSHTLPEVQRAWLRGRLAYIGAHNGSGQATVLAGLSPTHNRDGRPQTILDMAPLAYEPYPTIFDVVYSPSFRQNEAIADLRATTPEARVFREWRASFLERLLDM